MLLRTYQITRRLTLEKVILIYYLSITKCENLAPLYHIKNFFVLILNFLDNRQANLVTLVTTIIPGNKSALSVFVNLRLLSL
jgi:hypothetical protein